MIKHRLKLSAAAMMLAGTMCLTVLPAPVSAEETVVQEIFGQPEEAREIVTAQDFIESYLCAEIYPVDENTGEILLDAQPEYKLFEEVNEENFQQILDSKEVFDQLPEEVQTEIREYLTPSEEEFKDESQDQENTVIPFTYDEYLSKAEEVKEAKEQEEAANKEAQENAGESVQETEEFKPEEVKPEEMPAAPVEEVKPEEVPAAPAEEAKPQETPSAPAEETKPEETGAQEVKPEETPAVQETAGSKEEAFEAPVLSGQIKPAAPAAPVQAEINAVLNKDLVTVSGIQLNLTPEINTQQTSSNDTAVQGFINKYLTDNGKLISSASSSNYAQILSGLSTWNELSSSQRSSVNSWLKESAGTTFQALFSQAQTLKSQNGNSSTGSSSSSSSVSESLTAPTVSAPSSSNSSSSSTSSSTSASTSAGNTVSSPAQASSSTSTGVRPSTPSSSVSTAYDSSASAYIISGLAAAAGFILVAKKYFE